MATASSSSALENSQPVRDHRCKQDAAAIAQALYGHWREEHVFALQQALERYEFQHQQIAACDGRIAAQLQTFVDRSQGEPLSPQAGPAATPPQPASL